MKLREFCEKCEVWLDAPGERDRHPSGLGGHVVSRWDVDRAGPPEVPDPYRAHLVDEAAKEER